MTQKQALAFVRYTIDTHGALEGCQLIASALGITWGTVYGWYRRENVPKWRLEALMRARPAVIAGDVQAAE